MWNGISSQQELQHMLTSNMLRQHNRDSRSVYIYIYIYIAATTTDLPLLIF
jgi:hypothetical protein